jgi:hypothetical protein
LPTLKKVSEDKSNVAEELIGMLSNDLYEVFARAFKTRISENFQPVQSEPMKIYLSQGVQCDLIQHSQAYAVPQQDHMLKVSSRIKESTLMESEIDEPMYTGFKFDKSEVIEKVPTQQIAEGFVCT